jgi:hypothetical protein
MEQELRHVGRLVMELDPVIVEYDFEREQVAITQKGSLQTVTVKLVRDLAAKDGQAEAGAEDPDVVGRTSLVED